MDSMNLPLRGARESAIATRYVGAFVLPARRRRMCTAKSVGILLKSVRSAGADAAMIRHSAFTRKTVRRPRQRVGAACNRPAARRTRRALALVVRGVRA